MSFVCISPVWCHLYQFCVMHSPDGSSIQLGIPIWICIQLGIPTLVWYSTWNSNLNGDTFGRVRHLFVSVQCDVCFLCEYIVLHDSLHQLHVRDVPEIAFGLNSENKVPFLHSTISMVTLWYLWCVKIAFYSFKWCWLFVPIECWSTSGLILYQLFGATKIRIYSSMLVCTDPNIEIEKSKIITKGVRRECFINNSKSCRCQYWCYWINNRHTTNIKSYWSYHWYVTDFFNCV